MTKIGNNSLNDNENDDGNKTSKTKRREGDASQCVASFSPMCVAVFSTVCSSFSPMCVADPLFLLLSKTPIIASHAATRRLPFPKVCAQYPYIFHNFHIHPFSDGENKSEHQEHSDESCTWSLVWFASLFWSYYFWSFFQTLPILMDLYLGRWRWRYDTQGNVVAF